MEKSHITVDCFRSDYAGAPTLVLSVDELVKNRFRINAQNGAKYP